MLDITISADDIAEFHSAASDAQWWWHPDHGLTAVTDTPLPFGAVYLMPWDEAWFAQWDGDWQAAADQLNEIIEGLDP